MFDTMHKFYANYNLISHDSNKYNSPLEELILKNVLKPKQRIQGVVSLPKKLNLSNIENSEGGYYTLIPKVADACFDFNIEFEDGEEGDMYLNGRDIKINNIYTIDNPLFIVSIEFETVFIWTTI